VQEVRAAKKSGLETGPQGRGNLGLKRGGRVMRHKVMDAMRKEFTAVERNYLP
jgi:hypothetical protein